MGINMKKVQIVGEFLTEQMNHWSLFSFVLTYMGVVRAITGAGEPGLSVWALCGLIPPIFYLFRCRLQNLILFVLAHMGTACAVFALTGPSVPVRILCTVCAAGYLVHSFLLRLKEKSVYTEALPPVAGVGLAAGMALVQYYEGTRGWEIYYHFSLIACIALYFLICFLERYLDFLAMNQSSAGFLPASEMLRSGMGLAAAYTALGAGILTLSTQFEWLAGILRPIKDLLLRFLRFLFSFASSPPAEDILVDEASPLGGIGDMVLPGGEGKPFWLWKVLEALLVVGFAVAAVVLLLLLAWRLFLFLQKHMFFRYQNNEIQTGEAFDFRERCDLEKAPQKKVDLFSALSPRERIRRLYQKKLPASVARRNGTAQGNAQSREGLGLCTAREWEGRLSLKGMADIYERARYSRQEMTGADVKRMKEAWK